MVTNKIYKRKIYKRKTNKRNTNKRKTNKRKTNKRKTNKSNLNTLNLKSFLGKKFNTKKNIKTIKFNKIQKQSGGYPLVNIYRLGESSLNNLFNNYQGYPINSSPLPEIQSVIN